MSTSTKRDYQQFSNDGSPDTQNSGKRQALLHARDRVTDSVPGVWTSPGGSIHGVKGRHYVEEYIVGGIPHIMNKFTKPVVDRQQPGRETVVFIGASYEGCPNTPKQPHLPGAVQDMRLFFERWRGKPDKNLVFIVDFTSEAEEFVEELRKDDPPVGPDQQSTYLVHRISKKNLERMLTGSLPAMQDVSRVVIHVSCHGVRGGFVLPETPTQIINNAVFAKWILLYGVNRKVMWSMVSKAETVCKPLQMILYLDRCFAGDVFPMKWVFCVKTTSITRIKDVNKVGDAPDLDQTTPEKCHMHVVCLSACAPDKRTIETGFFLGGKKTCGIFTWLLYNPIGHVSQSTTTVSDLVYGWSSFCAHPFSMVSILWYHMDKAVCARMGAGFYWSTNVECAGTDSLVIKMPTDKNGELVWHKS
jgi:hypothetical protein